MLFVLNLARPLVWYVRDSKLNCVPWMNLLVSWRSDQWSTSSGWLWLGVGDVTSEPKCCLRATPCWLWREREGGGSACSSPPCQEFVEMSVTSEGSQNRQQNCTLCCSPEYSGEQKYRVGTNNNLKQHGKNSSFVYVRSSLGCNSGSTKSICFLAYDLCLFVSGLCSALCSWSPVAQ